MEDDILHPALPVAAVKDELQIQMIVIEYLNHEAFHMDWVRRQHW